MNITDKFRDQILTVMPELSQADAEKIATTEGCSHVTVYSHWKRLKNLEGDLTPIMISIAELAASHKKKAEKEAEREHKRLLKITRQLSAA